MDTFELKKDYRSITSLEASKEVYSIIKNHITNSDKPLSIDFTGVLAITTFCAKDIFGKLYRELGPTKFHEQLRLLNVKEDFKIVIQEGILDSIKDNSLPRDSRKEA